jgi:hypothetical protein
MAEGAGFSSEVGRVAGALSVEDGGDAAGPEVAWGTTGAGDAGGRDGDELDGVRLVGTPRIASDGEGGEAAVELTARGLRVPPAVPAKLEFHEFHRELYALLRRDAQLDDEAAQTVVNHVASMGGSPEGLERAVADLDGLVPGGLPKERLLAVRELLRRMAAEAF